MVTLPDVGLIRPTSMRIVVVFPAPFGPRKPKISPRCSSNETLSTMVLSPMILVRVVAVRVGVICHPEPAQHGRRTPHVLAARETSHRPAGLAGRRSFDR